MSTFSEMAEEWVRENLPTTEAARPATATVIGMLDHNPAAWQTDFSLWMVGNRIRRENCDDASGIACLHLNFCDWTLSHASVPCTLATFERLLMEAGFHLKDGMVLRLLLREDFEAVMPFQATPENSRMSALAGAEKRMPAARVPITPASGIQQLPMLAGVRLVRLEPKDAPIRLSEFETVTDVNLFIRSTLRQVDARLHGKDWLSAWPLSTLIERLAVAGCTVELDDPRKALQ